MKPVINYSRETCTINGVTKTKEELKVEKLQLLRALTVYVDDYKNEDTEIHEKHEVEENTTGR
jgi:hypothetical protein